MRAPVIGDPWRLRQLRQFNFGFQYEEDGKLRVVIPLPGIDRDSLKVRAKENILSISANIREDLVKYSVRPDDSWDLILEQEVLPETAKAKYLEGVLLVDLDIKDPPKDIDTIEFDDKPIDK